MAKSQPEAEFGYPQVLEGVALQDPWTVSIQRDYSWQWTVKLHYDSEIDYHYHRVKDTFDIICDSGIGNYLMMFPEDNCCRKSTPDPIHDIEPVIGEDTILDTQRDVIVFLRQNLDDGWSMLDWLADWIERHHFEGIKENTPGMGPARVQRVYEEYETVGAFLGQSDEELLDTQDWLLGHDAERIDFLKGRKGDAADERDDI